MTVTAVIGFAVLLTLSSNSPHQGGPPAQTCEARIDGAAFPFLVPPHLVWDELWQRAGDADGTHAQRQKLATELGLAASTVEQIALTSIGRRAFAASQRAQAGSDPKLADIDASLDARDRLLSGLDTQSADRVQKWLLAKSAKPYRLGVAGERSQTAEGKVVCKLSVNGAVSPHLIPEWDAWRNYFIFMRDGAASLRDNAGRYAPDYIKALQQRRLGNSDAQVERLLAVLIEAANRIEHYHVFAASMSPNEKTARLIQTTMEMRARVRNEFPASTWVAILGEIDHIRRGTIFDFPPYAEEYGVKR